MLIRRKNTLYDIDDAEYTRHPVKTMHFFMKHCAAISVGSSSLVTYCKNFNENVFLLTSPVPDHEKIKEDSGEGFTIGWIGFYRAHRQSLKEIIFPVIKQLRFPLRFKLLGVKDEMEQDEIITYFCDNKNVTIETPLKIDWQNEELIYSNILSFDVGISPLIDNEFNRSKSAFKLKQCLSCGIPVLGSGVGENNRFLKDGYNGFICDSPSDFLDKIQLVRSANGSLYGKLSANAKCSFPLFSVTNYCSSIINYFAGKS